jgi:outer membrane protein assembly factor BamB
MRRPRSAAFRALTFLVAVGAVGSLARPAAGAVTNASWRAYLFGPRHSSFNPRATAITTGNVTQLKPAWKWNAPAPLAGESFTALYASPTVYKGRIYIGSNTGRFHVLDEATGAPVWDRFLGVTGKYTCGKSKGITSTATVAEDPSRGGQVTVYVGAGDGYLYALRASDGQTVWRAPVNVPTPGVNDRYNWGSPTLVNGRLYLGISSQCDDPLTRGGLVSVDQATGDILGTYYTVADGQIGGSIWSSAASDGSAVYVTTGNGPGTSDSFSLVKLDPTSMTKVDSWQIPQNMRGTDGDFGSSPTLFQATLNGRPVGMVGAVAKNTHFYAFRRSDLSAGPVWTFDLHRNRCTNGGSAGAVSGAAWDGSSLYLADGGTKIQGVCYDGSIRSIDPSSGIESWETGLGGKVYTSPTLDGAGVLAMSTYDRSGAPNDEYFVDAGTGAILRSIPLPTVSFPQSVFADQYVFVTTQTGALWAYSPP